MPAGLLRATDVPIANGDSVLTTTRIRGCRASRASHGYRATRGYRASRATRGYRANRGYHASRGCSALPTG